MKRSILAISLVICSFLESRGQSERELKELIVAFYKQNKQLTYKLTQKDSIITKQDSLISMKDEVIKSYSRDSLSFGVQLFAYRKEESRTIKLINAQATTITKQRKQIKGLKIGLIALAAYGAIRSF